jgi:prepilin-type N-terminal cleavage/methylation domain-containing protein
MRTSVIKKQGSGSIRNCGCRLVEEPLDRKERERMRKETHRYATPGGMEHGFTLIELMVVVLIIAILMAIAIPTYLSARSTANARAAQSNLRNAITTEATQFGKNNAFTNSISTLKTAEPALAWNYLTSASALPMSQGTNVYERTDYNATSNTSPTNLEVGALGSDNYCYYELDSNGQVVYGAAKAASGGKCTAPGYNAFYGNWSDAVSFANGGTATAVVPGGLSAEPLWNTAGA